MLLMDTFTRTTNFVITGQLRAGTALVQGALASLDGLACHQNLFHPDNNVRKACHEDYYGPTEKPDKFPEWFAPLETCRSAPQYLIDSIFNHPRCGEQAIGVRLPYPQLSQLDLYDLLGSARHPLKVIHVRRNPLACFVSLAQAQRSGRWQQLAHAPTPERPPMPVRVDIEELIPFVREHEAVAGKVRTATRGRLLVVEYLQLLTRYSAAMETICAFLGFRPHWSPQPRTVRLRHCGDLPQRILNWTELCRRSELRDYTREAA